VTEQLSLALREPTADDLDRRRLEVETQNAERAVMVAALKEKRELRRRYALEIAFARVLGDGGPVVLTLEDGREVAL
jgi:hypothetical protein